MRYTLRGGYGRSFSRNAYCIWTANGEQNFRLGQSSGNLSWSAAKASSSSKFLASALTVDSGSAPAYSTVGLWAQSWSLDRYGALILAFLSADFTKALLGGRFMKIYLVKVL
jgi:hypothetical protein